MKQSFIRPYLQLTRPPNLVTAVGDILAGYAAAGMPDARALPWLLLATVALYGGGVVLNDVFDSELDARERPERPIPSGRASLLGAAVFGSFLLALAVGAALLSSARSALIAVGIAFCAVLYDGWGKHRTLWGPINMGTCRGLNLLLGVSAAPALVTSRWYLACIPILYIAAITAVSAGEVHGGRRGTGLFALGLIALVMALLLGLTFTPDFRFLPLLPFIALFGWRVLPPFWRAYCRPEPSSIRAAVKAGVLSLILLDASIAAGYAGLVYGLGVLALYPVARLLARLFAVT